MSDSSLTELCAFFTDASRRNESLVLATIVRTEGSTYRKAGAQILISSRGATSGLLSGGCLEADLHERARRVLVRGRPERAYFDTREELMDPIFGLGAGCEGANDIWLQPAVPANGYASLPYLCECLERARMGVVATVIGGQALPDELGRQGHPGIETHDPLSLRLAALETGHPRIEAVEHDDRILEVFVAPIDIPTALLVCGGGPDAIPVAKFASTLGWRVTIYDHRPAFASAANFPPEAQVLLGRAEQLLELVQPWHFDAAVIMSHHLPSDIEYLRCLARHAPDFIGVLGPPARRAKLFAEVGSLLEPLSDRIYGPVGLDIGAKTPASIALSIIAQIHASLTGRSGSAFGAVSPR